MSATVLFVDDEEDLRRAAGQTLELADMAVMLFGEAEEALAQVSRDFAGILVTDIRMAGMDGLTLMKRCLEVDAEFPVILVTGHGDIDLAVRSMREGAYDFIEKPYRPARLVEAVKRALDKRRLTTENRELRSKIGSRDAIEARLSGRSEVMVALRRKLSAVAATEADVLVTGDTGTGKEVAARALHGASPRAARAFVAVNCAALPADLIESELFGHEAGAFAGAARTRFGKFEHARGGTLFLDEIDSLGLPLQAKLLHAIQNRQITRLGSNDPIDLDIRFVAASKRDLEAAAKTGEFRSDLLYRLNVVTLRMPNLQARREDIPRLFAQLVEEATTRYKRAPVRVPGVVLNLVASRDWPGNVRELRNAADRFALGLDLDLAPRTAFDVRTLADRLAEHEKSLIAAAITAHDGNVAATHEALGISRRTLYEKMRKYGLSRRDFGDASTE